MAQWRRNDEPPQSCPDFDDAIASLEKARKINSDLREWGEAGWESASEQEDEVNNLNNRIQELETQVQDLEATLAQQS